MRAAALSLLAALGLTAGLSTADATISAPINAPEVTFTQTSPVAAHNCGKGQRWVPAGYAKHGKYRAGHCAPS
jgi:hypothetical protein